jgi:hypothetical protein
MIVNKNAFKTSGLPLDALITISFTTLSFVIALKLWRADLDVPFNYWGDTLFYLSTVRSLIDGDWIWSVGRLGAPFGLDISAFPQNLSFTSLIMKIISLATQQPGRILNLYWLATFIGSAVFCLISLRAHGVRRPISIAFSVLYALLPYSFFRNTSHISMMYVFVPVVCSFATAVLIESSISGESTDKTGPTSRLLMLSIIAIGFDYIYNAFFASFFLVSAAAIGSLIARSTKPIRRVIPAILLLFGCVLANIAPSLYSWSVNGVPANMGYKSAAEAEVYGLKIRHMLTPPSLDAFFETRAKPIPTHDFPLENENTSAKLGLILAISYLVAITSAVTSRRENRISATAWAAGTLALAGTLLATVGGFGAIFNLMVSPDIRAYNRILPFLAFFSALSLGVLLPLFAFSLSATFSFKFYNLNLSKLIVYSLGAALLLIGIADQSTSARYLVRRYEEDKKQFLDERELVTRIESYGSNIRKVYQLPERPFPPDGGVEKMLSYDHARPYLWSKNLEWSWPNFSNRHDAWHRSLGAVAQNTFTERLAISGFDAIWLDRFGYSDRDFIQIKKQLDGTLGVPILASRSGRYIVYDLGKVSRTWETNTSSPDRVTQQSKILNPVIAKFDNGFYAEEVSANGERSHRWAKSSAAARVSNSLNAPRAMTLKAEVSGRDGGLLKIRYAGSGPQSFRIEGGKALVSFSFVVDSKKSDLLVFEYDGQKIDAPGDFRDLNFALVNPSFLESSEK